MTYVQPLILVCLVLILVGLLRARRLAFAGLLLLFLISWPPVDWLFSQSLESGYPVQPFPAGNAQAIVVLSSSTDLPRTERPYVVPDEDTYRRCEHAAWLYKNWRKIPVLASGGTQVRGRPSLASTMHELLIRAGVEETNILLESSSRSTYENALYSAEILRQKGITDVALVVEAYAMPRAAAAFRRQGINVTPAPYWFRRIGSPKQELLPTWKSIKRNEAILHEVIGIIWYRIRGWI